jgi:site-specific DNA-methyltransferase (adenine-specific)
MKSDRWELILGDALEGMRELSAGSVDAIMTSPPYADQRVYGEGKRGKTKHGQSRRQRSAAPALAAEWLEPFLEEMLRVCSPAGSLALNLGVVMRDGEESDWADDVLRRARVMGWKLLHRMVWHKPNAIPLSHAAYLHIKHEWVFWLAPHVDAYRGYDRDTRTPHAEGTIRRIGQPYMERKDERYSRRDTARDLHPDGAKPATVFTAGVGGGQGVEHPAPMAPELARHLVSLTTPPGGLVFDPFAGSATTGLAALERGRRFLGFEAHEPYYEEAVSRLQLGRFPVMRPVSVAEGQGSLL